MNTGKGIQNGGRRQALKKHPLYRHSHQWLDAVDLARARRIAEQIRANPNLVEIAWTNRKRWKQMTSPWPPAFPEWEKILAKNSLERALEILTQNNDEGQWRRQSDPFIGILTEEERLWFLEHYDQTGVESNFAQGK